MMSSDELHFIFHLSEISYQANMFNFSVLIAYSTYVGVAN